MLNNFELGVDRCELIGISKGEEDIAQPITQIFTSGQLKASSI